MGQSQNLGKTLTQNPELVGLPGFLSGLFPHLQRGSASLRITE